MYKIKVYETPTSGSELQNGNRVSTLCISESRIATGTRSTLVYDKCGVLLGSRSLRLKTSYLV